MDHNKENSTINQNKPSRRELLEQYLNEKKKKNKGTTKTETSYSKRIDYTSTIKNKPTDSTRKNIQSVKKTETNKGLDKLKTERKFNDNSLKKQNSIKDFSTPCFKKNDNKFREIRTENKKKTSNKENSNINQLKENNDKSSQSNQLSSNRRESDVRFHFAPNFDLIFQQERNENIEKLNDLIEEANRLGFEKKEKEAREIFISLLEKSHPLNELALKNAYFWIGYANLEEYFTKDQFKVMAIYEQASRNQCLPTEELETNLYMFIHRMGNGLTRSRRETFMPNEEPAVFPSEYMDAVKIICTQYDKHMLKKKPFGNKTPWEMIYRQFVPTSTFKENAVELESINVQSTNNEESIKVSNQISDEELEKYSIPNKDDFTPQKQSSNILDFGTPMQQHLFATPNPKMNMKNNIDSPESPSDLPRNINSFPTPFLPEVPSSKFNSFTPVRSTPIRKPLTPRRSHYPLDSPERTEVERFVPVPQMEIENTKDEDSVEDLHVDLGTKEVEEEIDVEQKEINVVQKEIDVQKVEEVVKEEEKIVEKKKEIVVNEKKEKEEISEEEESVEEKPSKKEKKKSKVKEIPVDTFATPQRKDNFAVPKHVSITTTKKKNLTKTEKKKRVYKKKDDDEDPEYRPSAKKKNPEVTPLRRSTRLENKTPRYKEIDSSPSNDESDDY